MPKMAILKRKGYQSPANLAYNGSCETASDIVESLYLLCTLVIATIHYMVVCTGSCTPPLQIMGMG